MPRLKHAATGVIVTVSDETAGALSGFAPVDEPAAKPEPKTTARRAKPAEDK